MGFAERRAEGNWVTAAVRTPEYSTRRCLMPLGVLRYFVAPGILDSLSPRLRFEADPALTAQAGRIKPVHLLDDFVYST